MARGRCEARPPAERGNPGASDPKGQARRLGPRVTAKEPRRAEFRRNEAERPVCRASVAGTEHEHERDGPLVTGDSDEVAHDAHAPPAADVDSKEAAVLPSERFSAGLSRPLGAFRGVAGRRGLAEVVARADGSADAGRLRCAGPCTVNPRARGCPAPQPRARPLARFHDTSGCYLRQTTVSFQQTARRWVLQHVLILFVFLENHVSNFSNIRVFYLQAKHIPVMRPLRRPQTMQTVSSAFSFCMVTFLSESLSRSGKRPHPLLWLTRPTHGLSASPTQFTEHFPRFVNARAVFTPRPRKGPAGRLS